MRHKKEGGADDAVVGAIQHGLGNRKCLSVEGADNAEFAVDGVRRGQQFSRRLAPQHVTAQRRLDEIGRIGLAALELADHGRPGESRHLVAQKRFKPRDIEAQPFGDLARTGKGGLAITHRAGV